MSPIYITVSSTGRHDEFAVEIERGNSFVRRKTVIVHGKLSADATARLLASRIIDDGKAFGVTIYSGGKFLEISKTRSR